MCPAVRHRLQRVVACLEQAHRRTGAAWRVDTPTSAGGQGVRQPGPEWVRRRSHEVVPGAAANRARDQGTLHGHDARDLGAPHVEGDPRGRQPRPQHAGNRSRPLPRRGARAVSAPGLAVALRAPGVPAGETATGRSDQGARVRGQVGALVSRRPARVRQGRERRPAARAREQAQRGAREELVHRFACPRGDSRKGRAHALYPVAHGGGAGLTSRPRCAR